MEPPLTPFQLGRVDELIEALSTWGSALYVEAPGAGKSRVYMWLCKTLSPRGPHLVVVPPGLDTKAYTERDLIITDPNERNAIQFTTYTKLKQWRNRVFHTIIFDEGHNLRNKKTKRLLAARRIHAINRVLVTGTPLQVKPDQLAVIFQYMFGSVFSSQQAFQAKEVSLDLLSRMLARFQDAGVIVGNPKLVDKERRYMMVYRTHICRQAPRQIEKLQELDDEKMARAKADQSVLKFLAPPPAAAASGEKKAKAKAKEEKKKKEEAGDEDEESDDGEEEEEREEEEEEDEEEKKMSEAGKLGYRYSQYAGPPIPDDLNEAQLPTVQEMLDGSGKFPELLEIVQKVDARGERLLIFVDANSALRPVQAWLILNGYRDRCREMSGTVPPPVREAITKELADPKSNVLCVVGTWNTMSTGYNMIGAQNIVAFSPESSVVNYVQACARIARFGQSTNRLLTFTNLVLDSRQDGVRYHKLVTRLTKFWGILYGNSLIQMVPPPVPLTLDTEDDADYVFRSFVADLSSK